jgi:hypothetical protein
VSYGVCLRFNLSSEAAAAARELYKSGLTNIEAYGPYPDEELIQATTNESSKLPLIALVFGAIGAAVAYYLQYWTASVQYPLNIGGRPLHSWPAFIPVTFELTILFSACAIIGGFLIRTGLPRLNHPIFNASNFERATDDSFFLCVTSKNSPLDLKMVEEIAHRYAVQEVSDVPL